MLMPRLICKSQCVTVFQPDMIHLELDRTCLGGLGFSLVTAEKNHQTGVFVRSIRPNSQAAQDGRLRVMDRIVQVFTKIYRYIHNIQVYTKIYRYTLLYRHCRIIQKLQNV